ncbi:MAG: hypothetical protein AB9844_04855 [Clostridiaceae bacterium]
MLRFDISPLYKGTGVSQGLDRGLLVYKDDVLLAEEGMGLGACAFQADGYTYFTSIKSIYKTGNSVEVIFSINIKLQHMILGISSDLFTRYQEYIATNIYMKHEKRQELLLNLGGPLRKLFNLKVCFIKGPPLGEVKIKYELGGNDVSADLSCETGKKTGKLFVMNELGGRIFDKSIMNGEFSDPPSGWEKMVSPCELYSSSHSLTFTVFEKYVPDNVKSNICWGREQIDNHCCWAGFESEITCDSNKFENYRYSIAFREVEK